MRGRPDQIESLISLLLGPEHSARLLLYCVHLNNNSNDSQRRACLAAAQSISQSCVVASSIPPLAVPSFCLRELPGLLLDRVDASARPLTRFSFPRLLLSVRLVLPCGPDSSPFPVLGPAQPRRLAHQPAHAAGLSHQAHV
jgi:hypothetical protein